MSAPETPTLLVACTVYGGSPDARAYARVVTREIASSSGWHPVYPGDPGYAPGIFPYVERGFARAAEYPLGIEETFALCDGVHKRLFYQSIEHYLATLQTGGIARAMLASVTLGNFGTGERLELLFHVPEREKRSEPPPPEPGDKSELE